MADVRGGSTKIEGQTAAGNTLKGNPNLIGGSDGTNVQNIKTDSSGNVSVVSSISRTAVSLTYTSAAPPITDTMVSLVPNRDTTAGTAVSTGCAVTTGKRLRITSITLSVRTTALAAP